MNAGIYAKNKTLTKWDLFQLHSLGLEFKNQSCNPHEYINKEKSYEISTDTKKIIWQGPPPIPLSN